MAVVEEHTNQTTVESSPEDMHSILEKQRAAFLSEGAPSLSHRQEAIEKVHRLMIKYKDDIVQAISDDFGNRSFHETLMAEVFITLNAIKHNKKAINLFWGKAKHIDAIVKLEKYHKIATKKKLENLGRQYENLTKYQDTIKVKTATKHSEGGEVVISKNVDKDLL